MIHKISRATFAATAMSRINLEEMADRYLNAMYPQNLIVPTRLNVVQMMDRLEKHFGIVFGVSEVDAGEEGHTDPIKREIVLSHSVWSDLETGDGRARQTACHEVGHIHHIRQVRDIIRDGGPQLARRLNVEVPIYRDPEWQANGIGSAMLMPRSTTPIIYRRGGITEVVEFFQVSSQNAEVRINVLRRLGLL